MKRSAKKSGIGGAVALIVVAVLAAIAPIPASTVERLYSGALYPKLQWTLTSVSNISSVAFLDVAVALLLLWLTVRVARAGGRKAGARVAGLFLLKAVAVIYLLFLVFWGMNYRRVPIEQKLDFDAARVTRARAFELAAEAVRRVNALYGAAHASTMSREGLRYASAAAQHSLGLREVAIAGVPKRSLLGYYFRYAAIDGMTNPIFLEVILNPDLLPVEQPEVLAHEWAHLAGFADESEANFLAWLTCLRGDALAQYSGWLAAYGRAASVLPPDMRKTLPALDAGPRQDLNAIAARYQRSSPVVRRAARDVYDSYLKANRIEEGIANYDAVLQLMLGTSLGSDWSPGKL